MYLHGWLNCMVNVGKYTSPMDAIWDIFRPKQHLHETPWSFEVHINKGGALAVISGSGPK